MVWNGVGVGGEALWEGLKEGLGLRLHVTLREPVPVQCLEVVWLGGMQLFGSPQEFATGVLAPTQMGCSDTTLGGGGRTLWGRACIGSLCPNGENPPRVTNREKPLHPVCNFRIPDLRNKELHGWGKRDGQGGGQGGGQGRTEGGRVRHGGACEGPARGRLGGGWGAGGGVSGGKGGAGAGGRAPVADS